MKFLILIILMTCKLQCIDKDNVRFEFIDSLIKNPKDYEKIIEKSKYYDDRFKLTTGKKYNMIMVQHIKTYFYQEKYDVVSDTLYYYKTYAEKNDSMKIFKNIIHIKSKGASLYFIFLFIKDKWIIFNIDKYSNLLKSIDGMID